MKEKYIEYTKDNFEGKILDIILKQIELFHSNIVLDKHTYEIGQLIKLEKGAFIHGIQGELDSFDWVLENGFISSNFAGNPKPNKFFNSVGMWNIKEEKLLKDYILEYSGMTIRYFVDSKIMTELVPYKEIENKVSLLNNDKNIWKWQAEQTKEIRFMPSLDSEKVQLAFILNMKSDEAKLMKEADIFNESLTKEDLKYFVVEQYLEEFVNSEADAFTTNREAAIIFGLPNSLIEGVLVGRKFESDKTKLKFIKHKLPNAYICNLDGIVIQK